MGVTLLDGHIIYFAELKRSVSIWQSQSGNIITDEATLES
jgi:hypothetical protein